MGVTSEGQGRGSTFFFELPLFGPGKLDSAPTNSQPLQEPSHSMEGSRYIHFDRVADLEMEDESDNGGGSGGSGDVADAVLAPPSPAAKPRNEGRLVSYYTYAILVLIADSAFRSITANTDDVDAPAKISGSLCFLIVVSCSAHSIMVSQYLWCSNLFYFCLPRRTTPP